MESTYLTLRSLTSGDIHKVKVGRHSFSALAVSLSSGTAAIMVQPAPSADSYRQTNVDATVIRVIESEPSSPKMMPYY
jgi:hypothetical protein